MNILYFTPFYPPQSEAAATRSYWFVKTLKEAQHSVKIITQSNMSLKLATNKDKAVVRLIKENLVGIELFLKILINSGDRVVLSSPPFFTICWGAAAAILSRKPYLLDIRDLYPDVYFEMGLIKRDSFLGKLAKAITKILYSKAKGIMTVTQGLVNEISGYGDFKDKLVLVMNGYDPELFYPGKPEEKFQKFTLVFHGTLGKAQNIQTLIKLAKEFEADESVEFVVAGDGPRLTEILEANQKNVRYLGNLNYQEIPELLRKCHVGLSFRTDDKIGKEAFPVKVFEYIGSGLPVVMSPKGEAGEILEKNSLGRQFENPEIQNMAQEILTIKSNYNASYNLINEYSRKTQSAKILNLTTT